MHFFQFADGFSSNKTLWFSKKEADHGQNCLLFRPLEGVRIRMGFSFSLSFFLFSTQCQAAQKIIGTDRVIYQLYVFSVVIQTILKIVQTLFVIWRKTGLKLPFFV